MTTLIVLLAALGILVMLGAALTFSWLGGMAAGRAVQWAMDAGQPRPEPVDAQVAYYLSPQFAEELAARRAKSERLARESLERAERMASM
ncbi:hypothetical protein M4R22_10900 [Acidovorax sp. GBBC 3334]|uniref:hypothetical protein n=1 Tax=Acidovorax sp. GBBC 3334 TaxID=2940496 RepID=UPI0023031B70|nr:hypothetical protein [Acidovorax sp. GBBC 3334]MDA8455269.1 hypothetical protein [Acidovorax sp. GBBC 3334]